MGRRTQVAILFAVGLATYSTLWPATGHAQFYPYPPPYGAYSVRYDYGASVRLLVTPKAAEVYIDGYYAGLVDDFDGFFQRLHVPPGEHEISLYRDGYKAAHQKIYLVPRSTYKLRYTLAPLAPGEASEPRPAAQAPPPGQQPGPQYPPQRMPPPQRTPPPPEHMPPAERVPPGPPSGGQTLERSRYGTLSIRVQPANAEVMIDGERWRGPENDEHLIVQVSEGPHHVEVQKDGFQKFSADVHVTRGETTPVNVSLLVGKSRP